MRTFHFTTCSGPAPAAARAVRRAIDGEEGVAELAATHYPMSFAAVQRHVAVLERAGLVSKHRIGAKEARPRQPRGAGCGTRSGWRRVGTGIRRSDARVASGRRRSHPRSGDRVFADYPVTIEWLGCRNLPEQFSRAVDARRRPPHDPARNAPTPAARPTTGAPTSSAPTSGLSERPRYDLAGRLVGAHEHAR